MAQHDYQLADDLGLGFRTDLNGALAAMASTNLGAVVPPRLVPGMTWLDTRVPETLRLRNAQDSDWLPVAVGAGFLPLTGGTINGNLAVAGIFHNPAFELMRVSHAGTSPPLTNLVGGMLWYDTTTTLGKLKILAADRVTWLDVLNLGSPVFSDYATINSVAGNAQLNLIAATERRRVVGNQAALRFDFYGPADQLTAAISDAGDLYVPSVGWVLGVIASKAPTLPFVPVRQYDANTVQIGGSPAHLYIAGADRGEINTSATIAFHNFDVLGSWAFLTPTNAVAYNGLVAGSNLKFYRSSVVPTGTWRNMESALPAGRHAVFQRQA